MNYCGIVHEVQTKFVTLSTSITSDKRPTEPFHTNNSSSKTLHSGVIISGTPVTFCRNSW